MMKKMKLKKKLVGCMLSVMVLATSTVGVCAASFSYPGTVDGDGVRLRKYPDTGTILELMYRGERVHADLELTRESGAAFCIKRDKTGTIGYTAYEYIDLDYPMP